MLPLEELLLHPQCKTIDEEMTLELEQNFERKKRKIIFDSINVGDNLNRSLLRIKRRQRNLNEELLKVRV
jgi:hypothetical protein